MNKELSKKLKDLDAEGKLETYKSVVANAANFSINPSGSSSNLPASITTSGSSGKGVPYITTPNNPSFSPTPNPNVINVPFVNPDPNSFKWTIDDNTMTFPVPASGQELLGMLVEGKDLIKDKDEFLDVILRLPSVGRNNLKAIEVYERLRKLAITTGLVDADIVGDKEK